MKSSSSLFPVALMRADDHDGIAEDTYLLKPNNSPDRSVQIALTRLTYSGQPGKGMPVIMVHGSFSNRSFWLSNSGKGLAMHLLEQGFDPWMLDLRGHGDSPVNKQYAQNCVEDYARFDLPAVQAFVAEQTGQAVTWLGHSYGGVTIATALASHSLDLPSVAGVVLIGSQVTRFPLALRLPLVRLFARMYLRMRGQVTDARGPEAEPAGVAREFARWAGWFAGWRPKKGTKFKLALKEVDLPLLAVAAAADKGDPAKHCQKLLDMFAGERKTFINLGIKQGYSKDYGHVNMVISESAQTEVWPLISGWLNDNVSNSAENK
ncbi:MAG: alpha/beta fold hydrolase [Oceanospirillaceae bacterium]|nr:alpha/beta fold hydrolase [Oceanospirillaceae bacterium]MCP5349372.1 alpha/beta fold hydrolase [Oceanospirillaceae bacterium]